MKPISLKTVHLGHLGHLGHGVHLGQSKSRTRQFCFEMRLIKFWNEQNCIEQNSSNLLKNSQKLFPASGKIYFFGLSQVQKIQKRALVHSNVRVRSLSSSSCPSKFLGTIQRPLLESNVRGTRYQPSTGY